MRRSRKARISTAALAAVALAMLWPALARAQTFETPLNISKSPGFSLQPHMVMDGAGTLHVAWSDDTGQPGSAQIFYAQSSDQGRSFTPPRIISSSANGSFRPRMAVHGSVLYVVWMEDVSDTKDIIFTRSFDGGANFDTPKNISNTAGQSFEARVAVNAAGTVFVVWDEETPTRHIAIARSSNQGASFAVDTVAQLFRPLTDCPADASPSSCTAYPGIAVDPLRPNNVYVTWHDKLPGQDLKVFFTRSTDGGGLFEIQQDVSHPTIHAHCASLNVGPSGKILIAWENRKQPASSGLHRHDSYFSQSTDGGSTFSPPVNVSGSPNATLSDYPWATEAPDGTVAVGYEDNAVGGALDAVVKISRDGGATFGPRIDVSNNPAGTSTEVITLFGPDGTLYVLWEDHGGGDESVPGDIFLARAPATAGGIPPLSLALSANAPTFRPLQPMTVQVTAANPGIGGILDVYVGVVLPPAAGPQFGCPAGDAIVFFTPGLAGTVTVCGASSLQGAPAAYPGVQVPASLSPITVPILSFVWPGGLPGGTYRFFMLATPPGALADGRLDPGDTVVAGILDAGYAP